MKRLLEGKVAIITGGASGIGLATVKRFIEEGANVIIADIQDQIGQEIANKFDEAAIYVHTDVTNEKAVEDLVSAAVSHFGKLDIMFNNAGATGESASILDINAQKFHQLLDLDICSVIYGHKFAGRQFRDQGTPGSIITTASIAAIQGGWSSASYTTVKHAIVGTIRHSAKELSSYGIRTNAIAPGVIMTPLLAKAFNVPKEKVNGLIPFIEERLGAKQALGRYGTMEDVANTALFLASDLSAYISGMVIPVDGGITSYTQSLSDEEIAKVAQEYLAEN